MEYPSGFSSDLRRKPICGVLAVAMCAGVSYPVAHATCKATHDGQRFGGRMYFAHVQRALKALAVKFNVFVPEDGLCQRLRQLIEHEFKPGVMYICHLPGHFVTVKGDMISDQSGILHYSRDKSSKRMVKAYLEITGKGW